MCAACPVVDGVGRFLLHAPEETVRDPIHDERSHTSMADPTSSETSAYSSIPEALRRAETSVEPVRLSSVEIFPASMKRLGRRTYAAARLNGEPRLISAGTGPRARSGAAGGTIEPGAAGFDAPEHEVGGIHLQVVPIRTEHLHTLWELFPSTRPRNLADVPATFGTGDRLGMANIGHVRAFRGSPARPVLAQQSVRELTQTGRSFADVVAFAGYAVFREGYTAGFAADGDHLKRIADIAASLDAGATMLTLDLSEALVPEAMLWSDADVSAAFKRLTTDQRRPFETDYAGARVELDGGVTTISESDAKRCAVVYAGAVELALEMREFISGHAGEVPHIEISIDETSVPTEPTHHYMIVQELVRRGCRPDSIAPRFIGEFQKGIDYKGDLDTFAEQIRAHQAVADAIGSYKLSIHSGSDKFSAYPAIAAATRGRLHVKTSGTSWLEAVRTVAQVDPALYREMHTVAVDVLEEMKALYHITPTVAGIVDPETLEDAELAGLMESPDARQLLHVAYGKLLNHTDIGPRLWHTLQRSEGAYVDAVETHIRRHLRLLGLEGT